MTGRKKRAVLELVRSREAPDPRYDGRFLGIYVLDGHTPVPCADSRAWGAWFNDAEARRVGKTEVGVFTVYTTFLGIDHNFHIGNDGERLGPPLLFETMVDYPITTPIRGPRDHGWLDLQKRYSTWEQAEAGHERAVMFIRNNYDTFMAKRTSDEDLTDEDA